MLRKWLELKGLIILPFNPILHGLFQVGSTRGGYKVPTAFFSETVKATAIKLGTLIKPIPIWQSMMS